MVNHHTLAEGQFSDDHFVVYLAPLKQARVIDGELYLAWRHGNDRLRNVEVPLPQRIDGNIECSVDAGIVLEGTLTLPGGLFIGNGEDAGVRIQVDLQGVTEIGPGTRDGAAFACQERVDRELTFGPCPRFRLLLNHTMLEFYLGDILIQCYTMARTADGTLSCRNVTDLRLWQWS